MKYIYIYNNGRYLTRNNSYEPDTDVFALKTELRDCVAITVGSIIEERQNRRTSPVFHTYTLLDVDEKPERALGAFKRFAIKMYRIRAKYRTIIKHSKTLYFVRVSPTDDTISDRKIFSMIDRRIENSVVPIAVLNLHNIYSLWCSFDLCPRRTITVAIRSRVHYLPTNN